LVAKWKLADDKFYGTRKLRGGKSGFKFFLNWVNDRGAGYMQLIKKEESF